MLINRIVLFPDHSQIFMGSSILQIVCGLLRLFSELGQLSSSYEGEIVVFYALIDGGEGGQLKCLFGVVSVFRDGVLSEIGGVG